MSAAAVIENLDFIVGPRGVSVVTKMPDGKVAYFGPFSLRDLVRNLEQARNDYIATAKSRPVYPTPSGPQEWRSR